MRTAPWAAGVQWPSRPPSCSAWPDVCGIGRGGARNCAGSMRRTRNPGITGADGGPDRAGGGARKVPTAIQTQRRCCRAGWQAGDVGARCRPASATNDQPALQMFVDNARALLARGRTRSGRKSADDRRPGRSYRPHCPPAQELCPQGGGDAAKPVTVASAIEHALLIVGEPRRREIGARITVAGLAWRPACWPWPKRGSWSRSWSNLLQRSGYDGRPADPGARRCRRAQETPIRSATGGQFVR